MWSLKAVGPMGRSADQGGRPTTQWAHRPSLFVLWTVLWAYWSLACILTFVTLVSFSGGPSNPCDACVAAFDWMASCSLAEKSMIALHFQLKSALKEI